MKKRPDGMLNHNEHDFLVHLAEGLSYHDWVVAASCVGWKEKPSVIYRLMERLHVEPQGEFEDSVKALKATAERLGYANSVVYGMFDSEPYETVMAELGEIPPRFVPILTGTPHLEGRHLRPPEVN